MTTPTPAQIAEGRDEALDHLGIDPQAWDRLPGATQRARLASLARTGETNRAAVVTVATTERDLAAISIEVSVSFDLHDHKVALDLLDAAVREVKAQIEETKEGGQ